MGGGGFKIFYIYKFIRFRLYLSVAIQVFYCNLCTCIVFSSPVFNLISIPIIYHMLIVLYPCFTHKYILITFPVVLYVRIKPLFNPFGSKSSLRLK